MKVEGKTLYLVNRKILYIMKFGIRKPSIAKSIASRTSSTRLIKNALGLKTPRGWGWLTNPKKAAYNRVYNRTTFSFWDILKKILK